jgi:hypothetical protein
MCFISNRLGKKWENQIALRIDTITLSTRRPFSWRTVLILGLFQFLGNVASIPMLQAMNISVEPIRYWFLYTALSFIYISIALFLARGIGLGLPLFEGQLKKGEISDWARRVFGCSILLAIASSLPILLLNLNATPERIPAAWKMILASVDAGIQEEIFYRFFLMTLLAWLVGWFIMAQWSGTPNQSGILDGNYRFWNYFRMGPY